MVQWSEKECQVLSFPSREAKLQVKGLCNGRVRHSIYETKLDRRDAIGREMLSLDNAASMKESDDPESTRDLRITLGSVSVVKERRNESRLERADVPSKVVSAQGSSVQSSGHA